MQLRNNKIKKKGKLKKNLWSLNNYFYAKKTYIFLFFNRQIKDFTNTNVFLIAQ